MKTTPCCFFWDIIWKALCLSIFRWKDVGSASTESCSTYFHWPDFCQTTDACWGTLGSLAHWPLSFWHNLIPDQKRIFFLKQKQIFWILPAMSWTLTVKQKDTPGVGAPFIFHVKVQNSAGLIQKVLFHFKKNPILPGIRLCQEAQGSKFPRSPGFLPGSLLTETHLDPQHTWIPGTLGPQAKIGFFEMKMDFLN